MSTKLLGAMLIISACFGAGSTLVTGHIRQERVLKELASALRYMAAELQCRLTPLPALCAGVEHNTQGYIQSVFHHMVILLAESETADAFSCMVRAIDAAGGGQEAADSLLRELGRTLGRFDLDGQLKELQAIQGGCQAKLKALGENKEQRLRSYQTLGLCTGAAIAIMMI